MNKSFVIDTSVVMTWCFKDEVSQYADSILDSLEHFTAIAPSIWPLEVGNVSIMLGWLVSNFYCRQEIAYRIR